MDPLSATHPKRANTRHRWAAEVIICRLESSRHAGYGAKGRLPCWVICQTQVRQLSRGEMGEDRSRRSREKIQVSKPEEEEGGEDGFLVHRKYTR